MPDYSQEEHLARAAGDIMFSDAYLDLLERVYSTKEMIAEFEKDPRQFLTRHGIYLPDGIEVVLHDRGAVGKLARVDFHWSESAKAARSDKSSGRQRFRELARLAWETLHSDEMRRLRQTAQSSPVDLKQFAANPKAYAASHGVTIPDGLELIAHIDHPEGLRVDLHFHNPQPIGKLAASGGCCYCRGGGCCYYAGDF